MFVNDGGEPAAVTSLFMTSSPLLLNAKAIAAHLRV